MSRATLDYLEGLPAPETFIGASGRRLVNEFAKEQMRQALSHIKVDAQGQQFIEPIELIARLELVVLTAQIGTTHDMDLAELTSLGVMSALNRALDGYFSPSSLVVRRAITSRVHTLLEQRPELLHPNLRVAKSAADEGNVWMLRFLVQHNVALDPERLLRMAREPGPAGQTLQKAIQEGKSYGAPPSRRGDQAGARLHRHRHGPGPCRHPAAGAGRVPGSTAVDDVRRRRRRCAVAVRPGHAPAAGASPAPGRGRW